MRELGASTATVPATDPTNHALLATAEANAPHSAAQTKPATRAAAEGVSMGDWKSSELPEHDVYRTQRILPHH